MINSFICSQDGAVNLRYVKSIVRVFSENKYQIRFYMDASEWVYWNYDADEKRRDESFNKLSDYLRMKSGL